MPIDNRSKRWWSGRNIALISLLTSFLETIVVWGAFYSGVTRQSSPSIVGMTDWAWLLGGPGSFVLALVALFADSRRSTAFVALAVALILFVVCGLTKLV